MSNDKTLWIDTLTGAFGDPSTVRLSRTPIPGGAPYVPAARVADLRAENERLRATLEGATVLGAVSARHCGKPAPGELPCRRTPGHLDPCMGLFGEALAADLADARAEVDHLRGYVKDIIAESGRFAAARDAEVRKRVEAMPGFTADDRNDSPMRQAKDGQRGKWLRRADVLAALDTAKGG